MMNLTMLKNFLEAGSTAVDAVLDNWSYDKDSVRFFRASSNFIYTFQCENERFILRITPEGNFDTITNELAFLSYLKAHHVQVNVPIISKNGNFIETIDTPFGNFYAVVFNFLGGTIYEIEDLNESQYFIWGEALGNLHKNSKQYSQSQSLREEHTLQKMLMDAASYLPAKEVQAHTELKIIKKWMAELVITEQNYGLLHFDFELDNLIWNENNIQMIDFESCVNGWYIADIAFALRDLFPEDVDLSNPEFQLFIKGYLSKTEITESELSELSMFLRFHNLITFAKLLHSVDMKRSSSNPNWVEGLITKLEIKLDAYRNSFK